MPRDKERAGRSRAVEPELGGRLRELRTERGLSLGALAGRVGVSRSFLSAVERGLAYPSVSVLRALAAALDVPVFLFFTGRETNGIVVRKNERKVIKLPGNRFSYELVSPDVQHRMEMIITRVPVGVESSPLAHEGEECALVLEGKVVLTIGGVEYALEQGDSIYYNSGLPHKFRNAGELEAEIVSSISPPSF